MESSVIGVPESISPGLQREFVSAIERTGWTPQLMHAARVLPRILRMSPAQFEQYSAAFYQRSET